MIPTQSSSDTNGCNNISSNCVIWQGPDIACIDLCTGDTVSEVVAKLAEKLCDIISGVQSEPDLSGFDLKCALPTGTAPSTLKDNLQAIVDYICDLPTGGSGGTTTLPNINLCTNLQYNDPATGAVVTSLPLEQYALLVGNKVCDILDSITTINNTLTSLGDRITILENCVLPCSSGSVNEAQIISQCVVPGGQLTNVSVVLLALETRFCALETATGTPTLINNAISQQSLTSNYTLLSNPSTNYGSQTGWHTSTTTLAQSVQNQWIVLDDLYNAIQDIQLNCCPGACDSITVDLVATSVIDSGTGNVSQVNLNFVGSSIPSSFNDCGGFQTITITDVNGVSVVATEQVTSLQSNPSGVNVSVSSLNTFGDLSVSMNWCFNDGTNNCEGSINKTVAGVIECPTLTSSNETTSGFDVSFTNTFGTSALFTIEAFEHNTTTGSTNSTASETHILANQGSSVTQTFSALSANSDYKVRLTIVVGGQTKQCPDVDFSSLDGAPPCSDGMDVAFLVDYTGSMNGPIQSFKSGFTTLINSIDTASGANNYRVGVATVDEYGPTGTPTYSGCADYISLPAAQKREFTSPNAKAVITAWEMFSNNNGTSANTQVQKLAGGSTGNTSSCINLGSGAPGGAEPTDIAIELVMAATNPLFGAFRNNVAKYIVVVTDNLSGGDDGSFGAADYATIQSLIATANSQNVKVIVCGAGVEEDYNHNGSTVYPWQELATQTGGAFNVSADVSVIDSVLIASCSNP
tara:strand:- start:462 stop:2708 length:2247 start_codon:yes stop_codon:yes gene_type:complete